MGSTSDKASGLANQAVGKAKEGVGKAVGNDRLRAEGAAQEAKGKVQKAVGDAKPADKAAPNTTAAAIKNNLCGFFALKVQGRRANGGLLHLWI
jgi:uncharacterized protein YjbJ (UPF0337 family)